MQYSKGFGIITATVLLAAAVLLIADSSQAGTQGIPPLFREYPNARLSGEIFADDDHLNYRLPNQTEPIQYDVELTTNVHMGDKSFKGTVKIELRVIEPTRTIVLHARQLTIDTATIKQNIVTATEEQLSSEYEEAREFLTFTPVKADLSFPKDTIWILTIQYHSSLRTDNGGFYLSTYTDENNNTRNLATTQFESTDARHGFPCYDEPAKRANFTITINHAASYKAISNMPVDTGKSKSGTTVFLTSNKMPTYLVAFIISDFKWNEGQLNDLPQSVYSRPGTENDQEWALVSGMLITQRLAEYYGVDFTLPKLDQVAVPDFAAGAMENWGLVTYREEYLLYNKQKSTVNTQTNIASIIAHEYAHQWFGNLVAIRWWTYLWLKEGFATLFSYQAVDDAYPEWGYYQMFQVDDYQGALNNDASSSPRPMTHYVQQPNEISRLYDTVSYAKAGCVLHMWQNALTETVFKRGLNNYLTINNHQSAVEGDLFQAIQIAAKDENYELSGSVADMMGSWTQQGGYPLLTVERHYNGSFTITQKTFFNNETLANNDKLWYVPVNYATQTNSDFRHTEATHYLKKERSILVTDPKLSKDDWLILNKQSTSYYRINYDERNWNLITNGLIAKTHKIHPRNRAQLMHDAYRFSSSNRLKHNILLTLLTYLKNEDQYAPWSTANSILTTFNRYLDGDSDYGSFQYFVADLVTNIYERLGVNDIPGEQHFQKYTRSVVINLACLAGIESCLKETNGKLKDLVENGIEIEPNLQLQTYCNGLKQSGDKEFDYVYNQLMNSENQAQRRTFISSLGCAQKDSHIKKFVESSIDQTNKLRTQERSTLLSSAYTRGEVGLLASVDFLDSHWEEYAELNAGFGGGNPLDSDIRGISQRCNTPAHERRVLALVDKVKGTNKVSPDLEAAVKANIQVNFDWLAKNRVPIMGWVKGYRSGGVAVTASLLTMMLAFLVSRLF